MGSFEPQQNSQQKRKILNRFFLDAKTINRSMQRPSRLLWTNIFCLSAFSSSAKMHIVQASSSTNSRSKRSLRSQALQKSLLCATVAINTSCNTMMEIMLACAIARIIWFAIIALIAMIITIIVIAKMVIATNIPITMNIVVTMIMIRILMICTRIARAMRKQKDYHSMHTYAQASPCPIIALPPAISPLSLSPPPSLIP